MAAGEDSIQQTVQFFSEKEQISFEEIIVPGNFLKIFHENLLDPSVLTVKVKCERKSLQNRYQTNMLKIKHFPP